MKRLYTSLHVLKTKTMRKVSNIRDTRTGKKKKENDAAKSNTLPIAHTFQYRKESVAHAKSNPCTMSTPASLQFSRAMLTLLNSWTTLQSTYTFNSRIKESWSKGVYLLTDAENKKYIMKVKLNSLTYPSEYNIYKQLLKNPNPYIINVVSVQIIYKLFVVIYNYIDGHIIADDTNYPSYNDSDTFRNIFKCALIGMRHLHKIGICHNDIHNKNIMIAKQDGIFVPIIIDFDISIALCDVSHKTLKRYKDIMDMTIVFHNRYFYRERLRDPLFRISQELIDAVTNTNDIDVDYSMDIAKIFCYIMDHNYSNCPKIRKILRLL